MMMEGKFEEKKKQKLRYSASGTRPSVDGFCLFVLEEVRERGKKRRHSLLHLPGFSLFVYSSQLVFVSHLLILLQSFRGIFLLRQSLKTMVVFSSFFLFLCFFFFPICFSVRMVGQSDRWMGGFFFYVFVLLLLFIIWRSPRALSPSFPLFFLYYHSTLVQQQQQQYLEEENDDDDDDDALPQTSIVTFRPTTSAVRVDNKSRVPYRISVSFSLK